MYSIDIGWIAVALLVSMILATEVGYRLGFVSKDAMTEASRTHVSAAQASTLGILALLLAFTLSMSLQRFETRSDAVVDEANAIGTAYLRADLLPGAVRGDVRRLLRDYVDLRISGSALSVVHEEARGPLLASALQVQDVLWDRARKAAAMEPNPVTTGLFIEALNQMIDSYGRRDAAVNRRVPQPVVWLLYGTFLITGAIVGFSHGVTGQRPSLPSLAMVALIVALIVVILDLDRPRRGLIMVSQERLVELQASMRAGVADAPTGPMGRPSEPSPRDGQRR